jgi:hypothetical protein
MKQKYGRKKCPSWFMFAMVGWVISLVWMVLTRILTSACPKELIVQLSICTVARDILFNSISIFYDLFTYILNLVGISVDNFLGMIISFVIPITIIFGINGYIFDKITAKKKVKRNK